MAMPHLKLLLTVKETMHLNQLSVFPAPLGSVLLDPKVVNVMKTEIIIMVPSRPTLQFVTVSYCLCPFIYFSIQFHHSNNYVTLFPRSNNLPRALSTKRPHCVWHNCAKWCLRIWNYCTVQLWPRTRSGRCQQQDLHWWWQLHWRVIWWGPSRVPRYSQNWL